MESSLVKYRNDLPDWINRLRNKWVLLIKETEKSYLGYSRQEYDKSIKREMAVFTELANYSFDYGVNVFKDLAIWMHYSLEEIDEDQFSLFDLTTIEREQHEE